MPTSISTACQINQTILLEVAIGTNYFFEIAKLRALRLLFDLIAKVPLYTRLSYFCHANQAQQDDLRLQREHAAYHHRMYGCHTWRCRHHCQSAV
jgi:hypothetical protein